MKLFCKIGLHWKMRILETLFIDQVNGLEVYKAECPCGRIWMMQSVFGFPFFKVERCKQNDLEVGKK